MDFKGPNLQLGFIKIKYTSKDVFNYKDEPTN
jgi:hypothetical protein